MSTRATRRLRAANPPALHFIAKPSPVVDFAALTAEEALRRYNAAGLDVENCPIDGVDVQREVRPVVELERQGDAWSDGEGQQVSVVLSTNYEVHLEGGAPQAGEQHVDVEQHIVVKLNGRVSIAEASHDSSPSGSGAAAGTAVPSTGTVGDTADTNGSPSGVSAAPSSVPASGPDEAGAG